MTNRLKPVKKFGWLPWTLDSGSGPFACHISSPNVKSLTKEKEQKVCTTPCMSIQMWLAPWKHFQNNTSFQLSNEFVQLSFELHNINSSTIAYLNPTMSQQLSEQSSKISHFEG